MIRKEIQQGEIRAEGRFRKLLEPLQVRQLRFRNRMVKSATTLGMAAEDGNASPMLVDHYKALAKGGVGLLLVEASCVDFPIGGMGKNRLRLDDDAFIPSSSRLADAIHDQGCPVLQQIIHHGPSASFSGLQPLASSATSEKDGPVADPRVKYKAPRAMTRADIEHCIQKHADAAWRAKQSGFDGVEIHAGHSYLLNTFLSRVWNQRDDEYGCQSLETRTRFAADIVRAVRARVGSDFVISMRINGQEWGHERGTGPEESRMISKILESAGLDIVNVTCWGYGHGVYSWVQYAEQLLYPEVTVPRELVEKPGVIASRAATVKQGVSIPVIAVGSLSPELGEWILRRGGADAIAMGRQLLADPDLPRKVTEGRPEDIRRCMHGLECRTGVNEFTKSSHTRCRVNAALGKEQDYEIRPATPKKRVVVVGGGPAGMEAARVAAARGHHVVLYEKGSRLGGSLLLAAMIKGTEIEDLPSLVKYFETQLRKLDVEVKLRQEFTPEMARELKPEAIVIAIGGRRTTPAIPGIEKRNVLTGETLARKVVPYIEFFGPTLLRKITRFWLPLGKRVVIIGGQLHGCQLAEFLVKRGRQVTVVESTGEFGGGMSVVLKLRLLDWLKEKGVVMMAGTECEEITERGVTVRTQEGALKTIAADTVITALPPESNPELSLALGGMIPEVHAIGDCGESRLILQAIADGSRVGHSI